MTTWPLLDVVIPLGPRDHPHLVRFLQSLLPQTYPKSRLRVHVITEGNSEEAKALGILRSSGEIIGLFCADNVLREPDYLEVLVNAANQEGVTGSYTARYAYVKDDPSLNRYFALLGANDPLCWWIGKADRASYDQTISGRTRQFTDSIPSLGDNGFFLKRSIAHQANPNSSTHGSPMCFCEDLRRLGHATYAIVSTHATWHRTGETLWPFITRRTRYVRELYFRKYAIRRWRMVATPRDWLLTVCFALCSLLVVPQVLVSLRGYRRLQDPAWLWHGPVCLLLTLGFAWAMLSSPFAFQPLGGRRN